MSFCPGVLLTEHQRLAAERMLKVDVLFVFMGIGTGKTIAAINAAEALLYENETEEAKVDGVVVLTLPVLISAFEADLMKCGITEEQRRKYEIVSVYTRDGIPNCKGKLLIVDEVHNSHKTSSENSNYKRVMNASKSAKKKIFMSATPIVDQVSELQSYVDFALGEPDNDKSKEVFERITKKLEARLRMAKNEVGDQDEKVAYDLFVQAMLFGDCGPDRQQQDSPKRRKTDSSPPTPFPGIFGRFKETNRTISILYTYEVTGVFPARTDVRCIDGADDVATCVQLTPDDEGRFQEVFDELSRESQLVEPTTGKAKKTDGFRAHERRIEISPLASLRSLVNSSSSKRRMNLFNKHEALVSPKVHRMIAQIANSFNEKKLPISVYSKWPVCLMEVMFALRKHVWSTSGKRISMKVLDGSSSGSDLLEAKKDDQRQIVIAAYNMDRSEPVGRTWCYTGRTKVFDKEILKKFWNITKEQILKTFDYEQINLSDSALGDLLRSALEDKQNAWGDANLFFRIPKDEMSDDQLRRLGIGAHHWAVVNKKIVTPLAPIDVLFYSGALAEGVSLFRTREWHSLEASGFVPSELDQALGRVIRHEAHANKGLGDDEQNITAYFWKHKSSDRAKEQKRQTTDEWIEQICEQKREVIDRVMKHFSEMAETTSVKLPPSLEKCSEPAEIESRRPPKRSRSAEELKTSILKMLKSQEPNTLESVCSLLSGAVKTEALDDASASASELKLSMFEVDGESNSFFDVVVNSLLKHVDDRDDRNKVYELLSKFNHVGVENIATNIARSTNHAIFVLSSDKTQSWWPPFESGIVRGPVYLSKDGAYAPLCPNKKQEEHIESIYERLLFSQVQEKAADFVASEV